MKHFYIFTIALFFSTTLFSQGPWTFTNSNDIWESTGTSANLTPDATYSILTVNGAGNPQIVATAAAIDATNIYAVIKIKNNTSNTLMRVIYNTSGTNRFVDTVISANDTEVKTYYVTCNTNADWTGTVDNFKVQFRTSSSDKQTAQDDGLGNFYIDDITMTSVPEPLPTRTEYTFDNVNDAEGFVGVNGVALSQPTAGELELTIGASSPWTRLEQVATFEVDADTYKGVRLTFINNSSKSDFAFVSPSGGNQFSGQEVTILNDNTTVQTLEFDLSELTNWTGTQNNWLFQFVDRTTGSPIASAGTVRIQQILFIPSVALSTEDIDFKEDDKISIYPNPVNDIFKVKSAQKIEKMEVFNILGQQYKLQITNNTVDASTLTKGIYLLKVYQENNITSTKKFIKN